VSTPNVDHKLTNGGKTLANALVGLR
jgi:hypothetical protein